MRNRSRSAASAAACLLALAAACGSAPGATDAGLPDAGNADAGNPDSGSPDSGSPDSGSPDSGSPDSGSPDPGSPDAGSPGSGSPGSGSPDSGSPDSGSPDSGSPDSGLAEADAGYFDAGPASVLTRCNDNFRTCGNLAEVTLTPAAVASGRFGKLFERRVDGGVYAQPLVVAGLPFDGGALDVLFVATESNDVYAFDAVDPDAGAPLWVAQLGAPMPAAELRRTPQSAPGGCTDIAPEIGITSTPVIDRATGLLYVVAKSEASGEVRQALHALDLATGAEQLGGPVTIAATVTAPDGGAVLFDPVLQLNRPGLLLEGGVVYLAFGGHCDYGDYHGWVLGYDAATLAQRAVYNDTAGGEAGGIWQMGQGLATDGAGRIYFASGNGSFDADAGMLSDSIVALELDGGALSAVDSFTPGNQQALSASDLDLGTTGALVVPGASLVIGGGKQGVLYLLDGRAGSTKGLGGYHPTDQVLEKLGDLGPLFGNPALWPDGAGGFSLFLWSSDNALQAFRGQGQAVDPAPISSGDVYLGPFPGGAISLSAQGARQGSGIVWALYPLLAYGGPPWPAALRAFHAGDLGWAVPGRSAGLWTSETRSADAPGLFSKFNPPTVVNGRVYVPSQSGKVSVYGLAP